MNLKIVLKARISADNAWLEALWHFGISRLALVLVTFLAVSRLPTKVGGKYITPYDCIHHLRQCIKTWDAWDTQHYIYIAQYGYLQSAHEGGALRTAFFPLWPLLIRMVARPLGGTTTDYYLVSVMLSNLFFYLAVVVLYQLVQTEFGPQAAKRAVFFLSFYPYALFFSIGYTESLFLLLAVGAFALLKRDRWLLAGLCGGLATMTRPTGIALLVPFVVLALQRLRWWWFGSSGQVRRMAAIIGALALVPSGLLAYMLYLKIHFGDPLYFSRWERVAWGRVTELPWTGMLLAIQALFVKIYPFGMNFDNLFFVLLPLAAVVAGWRRLPLHYSLFALALIVFALSNPVANPGNELTSAPRYVMVAFPVFIVFAQWTQRPRVGFVLGVLFLTYFVYNTILFVTLNWVA